MVQASYTPAGVRVDARWRAPLRVLAGLGLLLAAPVQAADDGTAPAPADAGAPANIGASLLDLIDAAAGTPAGAPDAGPSALVAPPPPAPIATRGVQSLNPDVSVIVDGAGGYAERPSWRASGDDPDLRATAGSPGAGFTLQEAELALSAAVDPYLRGAVFLTIPNTRGLEVEEAYLQTSALPADLQVKAGVLRSGFGRQNGQHLHVQDFTRRALLNAAYLGDDGLRAPGAQLSWLVPVPFFLQANVEAFSVGAASDVHATSTFGGGGPTDLVYGGQLKSFAAPTESLSIAFGASAATGIGQASGASDGTPGSSRSLLFGGDLYVKWKPANQADTWLSVAWQTEAVFRKLAGQLDGGLYSQLVVQVARRWSVGLREDVLGLPASALQPRVLRTGVSVTFAPTEFSRLRLYGDREFSQAAGVPDATGAFLQFEISLGAHGAHAF